ncbi:MAG: FHA domain-containing protein [Clostridiales bacterium]|jgi:ribosomal protein L40E|nr:FHA domain-containing protein [Clostridiales bacterium]
MSVKKRGFFSWLFFQDPDKGKNKTEAEPQAFPVDSGIPDLAPGWANLSVFIDGVQTDMEMSVFPFNIGRIDSPGGIKIDDKGISRQHAIVDLQNGVLTITDANSKNGVTVGANKIFPGAPTPLQRGDSAKIGHAEIIFNDFSQPVMPGAVPPPEIAVRDALIGGTEFLPGAAPEAAPAAPQPPQPVDGLACVGCGAINKPDSKFCRGCGKPMMAAPPAPAAGPKPFCSKCGAKNVNLANFCAGCGNNLA